MARGGLPREGETGQRTCLGCRAVRAKRELRRFVVAPAGLVLDVRQALPGRGAYVCGAEGCAAKAARHLGKALRAPGLLAPAELVVRLARGEAVEVPEFTARPSDDEPVG
jgi:predicted RNA-binding protein YlxR (DUF448 family)